MSSPADHPLTDGSPDLPQGDSVSIEECTDMIRQRLSALLNQAPLTVPLDQLNKLARDSIDALIAAEPMGKGLSDSLNQLKKEFQ